VKGLLFTYALTFGGAATALFDPFVGLLIYVCFSILKPDCMWFWSVPPWHYSRVVAIGLLAGWALGGFGQWRLGRARGVVATLIGFWLWSCGASILAEDQSIAWGFVESLGKIILPFLVGITTIDSMQKLKQLAWVILLSQGYVAYSLNLSYYSGYNRVTQEGFANMDNNCVAIAMVTCVGLGFFLGLHAPGWWRKALAFGSVVLMAHVVMFAFSRGGMLALVITGATAFFLIPRRPRHYLAFALVAALCLRLSGREVTQRFLTTFADPAQRDTSSRNRLDYWGYCWDAMLRRPILGVGPDHWPLTVVKEYGRATSEAHSVWLQFGAELGFPGLFLILSFYGGIVALLWPLARDRITAADPWSQYLARMVIASLVGFGVSAQFVSLKGLELPYYIALIGAGVLKLSRPATPVVRGLRRRVQTAPRPALALCPR
jgi:probable O-glycosylation ligase (exosortase A-associated)